jgi:hypothetical protein
MLFRGILETSAAGWPLVLQPGNYCAVTKAASTYPHSSHTSRCVHAYQRKSRELWAACRSQHVQPPPPVPAQHAAQTSVTFRFRTPNSRLESYQIPLLFSETAQQLPTCHWPVLESPDRLTCSSSCGWGGGFGCLTEVTAAELLLLFGRCPVFLCTSACAASVSCWPTLCASCRAQPSNATALLNALSPCHHPVQRTACICLSPPHGYTICLPLTVPQPCKPTPNDEAFQCLLSSRFGARAAACCARRKQKRQRPQHGRCVAHHAVLARPQRGSTSASV